MSQHTKNRSSRLAAYSALAGGVIPVTAAMGAFVGQDGLNLVANPFSSVAVNMGPGYGEIFTFFVNTDTGSGSSGYGARGFGASFSSSTEMFVQFNPANTGGWTNASVVRYDQFTPWPRNMSLGEFIDDGEDWRGMNQFSSQEHLLARRFFSSNIPIDRGYTSCSFSFSTTTGDWAPDQSGYVGLRFTKSEGEVYQYAWILATANLDFTPGGRSSRGPGGPSIDIDAWGLESKAGYGIIAGMPTPGVGALAMLALGAAGIRRTRQQAA